MGPSGTDLRLTGIVWDSANPYALVNGEAVKIGDAVNGHTVKEIGPRNVVLENENDLVILTLS